MTRWQRFKLAAAQWLLDGMGFSVARTREIQAVRQATSRLQMYSWKSGGLSSPRRIHAQRKVRDFATEISNHASHIAVQ